MVKRKKDLEQIDLLHQKEKEATLKNDYEQLKKLIDVDAVIIPPGGPVQDGKPDIIRAYDSMKNAYRDVEIITYEQEFKELELSGDYAFEWGFISGRSKMKSDKEEYSSRYHIMRVLKKQKDGSWRIYRSIWNNASS